MTTVISAIVLIVSLYLVGIAMLVVFENRFIYFGATLGPAVSGRPDPRFEDARIRSADGTRLHGWYCEHPDPRAIVLFLHGNGDTVASVADSLVNWRDRHRVSILALDYRGYGRSNGKPTESGVLADATAASDWLSARNGIPRQDIVIWGRSLGGAIAIGLAAAVGARGLILERTFTSLPAAVLRKLPIYPAGLLMRNRFNSVGKIKSYQGPLLYGHGTADRTVSIQLGRQLFEASPSERKRFVEMPGVGHRGSATDAFYAAVDQFLEEL